MGAPGSKKRSRPLASALDATDAAAPNEAIGDEAGSSDDEDGVARESTLGERVAALQVVDSAAPPADAVQPEEEDGTITADSLSVLLTQVQRTLHSCYSCIKKATKDALLLWNDDRDMRDPSCSCSSEIRAACLLAWQALRSEDRSLLERCLNISNRRIIENTVRRLATVDCALFLRAAVQRLQSVPGRGQELHHWIQALLLQHTAYLMSAPGGPQDLSN